jgi:hypothetical protein
MYQQWRRPGKRKDRMKLSLPPILLEKLVWVSVITICKIFIPSYVFDPLLPPNHGILQITLL